MAKILESIHDLQQYLLQLRQKATHHATDVSEAILALAGMIVLFKDADQPLSVRTHDGKMANILWLYVAGQRYALRYDHDDSAIEIRLQTHRGKVLFTVTNRTPTRQVIDFFEEITSLALM